MKFKFKILLFSSIISWVNIAKAELPLWTSSNTQSLTGKMLRIVCNGIGPSLDLARRDVLEKCRLSAASHLSSNFHAKTLSVESEKEVAYHREVTEENDYAGLTCKPGREYIEELDGQSKVWQECTFDLSLARVKEADVETTNSTTASWVSNKSTLSSLHAQTAHGVKGRYLTSSNKVIALSVVPQCKDLIVRGKAPARTVKCTSDPVIVRVEPTDDEIIIRASGHIPKTVKLSEKREGEENVQVFLDPKD